MGRLRVGFWMGTTNEGLWARCRRNFLSFFLGIIWTNIDFSSEYCALLTRAYIASVYSQFIVIPHSEKTPALSGAKSGKSRVSTSMYRTSLRFISQAGCRRPPLVSTSRAVHPHSPAHLNEAHNAIPDTRTQIRLATHP